MPSSKYPSIKFSVDSAKRLRKAKYMKLPRTTLFTEAGPAAKTIWWDLSEGRDRTDRDALIVDRVQDGVVYFIGGSHELLSLFIVKVLAGDLSLIGVIPEPMSYTQVPRR